ncbi:MAG: type II toxin-antitoxin system death-on-curing family toxin [Chloroflexi bacterium]|nr:type II toxin-antitoxin system death-on-curing family toxin [Chloroflexota bacterium]
MQALTPQQVLFLHAELVRETGGEPGVRDLGLLLSALARPHAAFEGRDLYPDLFSKTAALMHSLVQNHAFVDGNKRIGLAVAGITLELNGVCLAAGQEETVDFVLAVARGERGVEDIAAWLRENSEAAG